METSVASLRITKLKFGSMRRDIVGVTLKLLVEAEFCTAPGGVVTVSAYNLASLGTL